MNFFEKSDEMKHRAPTTELERILHEYSWANSCQVLDVVVDNWKVLRQSGLLEEAFLDAWCINKHGVCNWHMKFCHAFFALLDPDKLRKAGDPLPDGDSFTVYRGVAGTGAKRRVRGYSWTGDEGIARQFADLREHKYHLPNPAVYRAIARREHVLAYIDASGRNEKEFLVHPCHLSNVKLVARRFRRK
jgi:hypothetical protein